jgi:hypothetical protein
MAATWLVETITGQAKLKNRHKTRRAGVHWGHSLVVLCSVLSCFITTVQSKTHLEFGLEDPDGCDTFATAMSTAVVGTTESVFTTGKTHSPAQMTIASRLQSTAADGMDLTGLETGLPCLTRAIPFMNYLDDTQKLTRYFGGIMKFTGDPKTYLIDEFSHVTSLKKVTWSGVDTDPPYVVYQGSTRYVSLAKVVFESTSSGDVSYVEEDAHMLFITTINPGSDVGGVAVGAGIDVDEVYYLNHVMPVKLLPWVGVETVTGTETSTTVDSIMSIPPPRADKVWAYNSFEPDGPSYASDTPDSMARQGQFRGFIWETAGDTQVAAYSTHGIKDIMLNPIAMTTVDLTDKDWAVYGGSLDVTPGDPAAGFKPFYM